MRPGPGEYGSPPARGGRGQGALAIYGRDAIDRDRKSSQPTHDASRDGFGSKLGSKVRHTRRNASQINRFGNAETGLVNRFSLFSRDREQAIEHPPAMLDVVPQVLDGAFRIGRKAITSASA
jgi:hypothetical protein